LTDILPPRLVIKDADVANDCRKVAGLHGSVEAFFESPHQAEVTADPDGVVRAARPKGSAVTSDGRYAVISGGARTTFEPSGTVRIIDLHKRAVVATVTGVGNDPYGLALVESEDD